MVCEGLAVIKYPCISTHRNVVGNGVEECFIDCNGAALKFENGVLVCHQVSRKISISKFVAKISLGNKYLIRTLTALVKLQSVQMGVLFCYMKLTGHVYMNCWKWEVKTSGNYIQQEK